MKHIKASTTEKMLKTQSIWKHMLLLSLPILFNNVIKSFHGMIDTYFVSRMYEDESLVQSALSAVNLHDQVYNVFLSFGIGLAVATIAIISQYLGAARKKRANRFAAQFVGISVIIAILFTVLVVIFAGPLVAKLGAKGSTATFAAEYFRIRSLEYAFVLFFMVYQAIRQASGHNLMPTILNGLGIFVNIIFTILFVSVFKWGIIGLALSTVIGNGLFVPFMIYDLFKGGEKIKIDVKGLIPRKALIQELLPFALPAATGQALSSVGFVIIQAFILYNYGDTIASAFAVGNRLSNLLNTPITAISSIAAVYIGTNIGNRQPDRAYKAYWTSTKIAVVMSMIFVAIAIPLRVFFIELLVSKGNPSLINIAQNYTFWLLLTQPLMALFQNYTAIFNGSGQSKNTFLMATTRLWFLRIPILLTLHYGFNMGYHSVWYAMIVSNVLVLFVAEFLRQRIKLDIKVKLEKEEETYA